MKTGEVHVVRVGRRAVECVTAREAARLCDTTEKAFRTYSSERRPIGNPAPLPIGRLLDSPAKLYPLKEVLAWRDARPGRGNRTPRRSAK